MFGVWMGLGWWCFWWWFCICLSWVVGGVGCFGVDVRCVTDYFGVWGWVGFLTC